jgi:hypothetical protein
MMKNLIFLTLFSINVIYPSYAYNKDPFQRWNRLENLIVQETQLLKKMIPLTFKEEYRLLELLSERLKIIKKKEHYKMITEKMGRERLNQKNGKKLYREIFARGKKLLKRKISKVLKARILYTLALNSRDYKLGKRMISLLTKALILIKPKTPLALTIHVQMAEFYYNKKQFKKAQKHYHHILKGKENKWYLKHLLNSAWCDFKLKKIKIALRKTKKTLLLNLTGRYRDNKFSAFEGFIVFSTYGHEIKKALRFFKKNKTYYKFDNTLKFAQFVSNQGLYNESLKILKFMDKENEDLIKNSEEAASLSFFKLILFDKFSKEQKFYLHLSSLKIGWEKELPEIKKRSLVKKLREKSLILQKEIYQKKKKRTVFLKRFEKAIKALIYLEPKEKGEFFYYLGEMFLFFLEKMIWRLKIIKCRPRHLFD